MLTRDGEAKREAVRFGARELVHASVIAAVYALLTFLLLPISSGLIQCRVSEALCVLPYFTPAAVPGLFVGCLLGNLLSGAPVYDVAFGSLATLLAAAMTYLLRNRAPKFIAPLPSVAVNAFVVGAVLKFGYGVDVPYYAACLYVAAGQALACYGVGMPLLLALERFLPKLFTGKGR